VRRGNGGIVPEVVRVVSVVVGGVATVEGSATDDAVGTASAVRADVAVGEGDPTLPSAAVEPAPPAAAAAAADAAVLDSAAASMMDAPSALVAGIKIAQ
jgi:hypothetical protein